MLLEYIWVKCLQPAHFEQKLSLLDRIIHKYYVHCKMNTYYNSTHVNANKFLNVEYPHNNVASA